MFLISNKSKRQYKQAISLHFQKLCFVFDIFVELNFYLQIQNTKNKEKLLYINNSKGNVLHHKYMADKLFHNICNHPYSLLKLLFVDYKSNMDHKYNLNTIVRELDNRLYINQHANN